MLKTVIIVYISFAWTYVPYDNVLSRPFIATYFDTAVTHTIAAVE